MGVKDTDPGSVWCGIKEKNRHVTGAAVNFCQLDYRFPLNPEKKKKSSKFLRKKKKKRHSYDWSLQLPHE